MSLLRGHPMGLVRRRGMTLVEIMIALALTTVIAGLVGGLMQWYVINRTRADTTFEQLRLARTVLSMIADDIRGVVRNEPFDVQPLVTLLQSTAGGQALSSAMAGSSASASTSGPSGASGTASLGASSGSSGGMNDIGSLLSQASGSGTSGAGESATSAASLPPGIIGSSTSIEVDISRPPRVDESIVQQPDIMAGTLNDLPTDIKTVTYYVQGQQIDGVTDSLSALSSDVLVSSAANATTSGLVRRMIARNVLQKAYLDGESDRINRTGSLVAREVVGLDFQYFDGTEWLQTWDSSTQGMPIVVRVTIALQSPETPAEQRLVPPLNLSMMAPATLQESGITIYSTLVMVPGAALATSPASSDDGSSELGL